MANKKSYSRYFIILQEDEKGHSISPDKQSSGYTKIEMKNDKCKVSFYVQNIKREKNGCYMFLIANKKDCKKIINLGLLNIDDNGRADVTYECTAGNIGDSNISMDKIGGAAIGKFIGGRPVFVMSGFASTEIPSKWKEYAILDCKKKEVKEENIEKNTEDKKTYNKDIKEDKSDNKEDKSDNKEDKSDNKDKKENNCDSQNEDRLENVVEENKSPSKEEIIESDNNNKNQSKESKEKIIEEEKNTDNSKEDKSNSEDEKSKGNNEFDEYERSIEESKPNSESNNKDNNPSEEEILESNNNSKNQSKESKGKIVAEANKEDNSNISEDSTQDENLDRNNVFDEYERKIENSKLNSERKKKEDKKDKNDIPKDTAGEFFKSIMDGFEEMKDVCSEIKNCKWYKVPVRDLEEMCNVSNYNKYTVVYYPMINYYPYIKEYGYYMMGLKCDSEGNLKYLAYGLPGTKSKEEQPYSGRTGFVTWAPITSDGTHESHIGYWIMFYDFKNSIIVVPMK